MLKAMEMPVVDGGSGPSRFDRLFAQFYVELFGLVYRVLGDRMETEDTLQEAFLKLADAADLQARPDGDVGAWLRRVGLNLAFNRLRSAKRTRARLERVGQLERSDEEPLESELTGPAGHGRQRRSYDGVALDRGQGDERGRRVDTERGRRTQQQRRCRQRAEKRRTRTPAHGKAVQNIPPPCCEPRTVLRAWTREGRDTGLSSGPRPARHARV